MPTTATRPLVVAFHIPRIRSSISHVAPICRRRPPATPQLRKFHIASGRQGFSRPLLGQGNGPIRQHERCPFSQTAVARHGHLTPPKLGEERKVTIIDQQGDAHEFKVADGDNLLDIAQSEELEMEGACGGSCACSTCHVIVQDQEHYDKMEEPDDDENDMLDLAFGLTETSRLGCQVKMSKELDGLVVKLPSMTRNLQKSDFDKR